MKSWNEASQDAKNKRRSQPSGKVRPAKSKKKKHIRIQCRYVGTEHFTDSFFVSDFFNREWHRYYSHYYKLKDAEQAIASLNKKERGNFEYRIKP